MMKKQKEMVTQMDIQMAIKMEIQMDTQIELAAIGNLLEIIKSGIFFQKQCLTQMMMIYFVNKQQSDVNSTLL